MRPRRHRLRDRRTNAGFTLIELIVVIVILGILVAVAAFTYNAVVRNARQDAVRKTAAQVATSLQAYSATKQAPYGAAGFDQGTVDGIVDGDTDATVSAMSDDPANGYATVTVTRDGYTVAVHCPLGKVGVVCRTDNGGGGGGVPPVVDAALHAVAVASANGSVGFNSIQVLPDGSAIVAGQASGTVTFGTHTVTTADPNPASSGDVVVAKLNADGTWAWATTAGGTHDDSTSDLAVDGSGNIYVAATVSDATFGSLPVVHGGLAVAKLTPDGAWVWATGATAGALGSTQGIAVTPNGDVVVVGTLWGAATFGPDTLTSNSRHNLLVAKLSSAGAWLWARRSDAGTEDAGGKVAVDGSGNIYVAAGFKGTSSFGGHPVTGAGSWDVADVKLDPSGAWLWATSGGSPGWDVFDDIAVDAGGHPVVAGSYSGNGSLGSKTVAADAAGDAVIAKLDPATGDPLWVATGGGDGWDESYGVAIDGTGNILVAGYADGSGGSYGALSLAGSGYTVAAKLTSAGAWTWVRRAGGTSYDGAYAVAVTGSGKVLAVGRFYDNATFGTMTLSDAGSGSGFVASWNADGTQP